jgi:hypothetical protein
MKLGTHRICRLNGKIFPDLLPLCGDFSNNFPNAYRLDRPDHPLGHARTMHPRGDFAPQWRKMLVIDVDNGERVRLAADSAPGF